MKLLEVVVPEMHIMSDDFSPIDVTILKYARASVAGLVELVRQKLDHFSCMHC